MKVPQRQSPEPHNQIGTYGEQLERLRTERVSLEEYNRVAHVWEVSFALRFKVKPSRAFIETMLTWTIIQSGKLPPIGKGLAVRP